MKNSVKIAVFFILHHLSFVIGVVTISFNSIGYIGQSIVLQCKDTASIGVNSANWYRGGSLLDITSSRYSQTNLSDGFSLTISSLLSTDGGVYHCGIEFGNSATKTLTIYYNTTEKDIVVDGDKTNKAIKITITAFPDPVYNINITEGGTQIFVIWIVTKTTTSNGAIRVLLQNSTAFEDKNYTLIVTITSPVSFIFITHVDFGSTTTTTTTVTLSSTSMSSATSSITNDSTSTNPTTRGSSASTTISTFISMSPTEVSPASNTNNTSTSTNPTISGSNVIATNNTSTSAKPAISGSTVIATNNTSTSIKPTISGSTTINITTSNKSKSIKSDTDIKVIVPAVVVPCGLLIIEAIILVVCCVRHRTRKNVHESPDGMAVQDKGNNTDGWKLSQGQGKATDNLDAVYTTPDGFIIYLGPAAMSTARSYKKHHDVTDQYNRPYAGPYFHQAEYFPSTYTSARAYTHKDTKHHNVGYPYSRPSTGTYGYQAKYVPSTYTSARTYPDKGKNYDYKGPIHKQASHHQMATSRPAYDQTVFYPQTGHYGQSGQDVYYSGSGQYSFGQRSRSHHDHSGRKQQREYYNQYEIADYGDNRAGYRHTKQDMAFYY